MISQIGTGVIRDGQVKVLRRAFLLHAAVGVSPADFGGQSLPLFKALFAGSALLQTGHDHLCQILPEPLEVLPEAVKVTLFLAHGT